MDTPFTADFCVAAFARGYCKIKNNAIGDIHSFHQFNEQSCGFPSNPARRLFMHCSHQ